MYALGGGFCVWVEAHSGRRVVFLFVVTMMFINVSFYFLCTRRSGRIGKVRDARARNGEFSSWSSQTNDI